MLVRFKTVTSFFAKVKASHRIEFKHFRFDETVSKHVNKLNLSTKKITSIYLPHKAYNIAVIQASFVSRMNSNVRVKGL